MQQLDPTNDTHNIMLSGWLIFLAMIFDALDGHVARLSRTHERFRRPVGQLVRRGLVWRGAGISVSENVSHVYLFARQGVDHCRFVCRLRGAAPGAVQRRELGEDDDHMHFSGLPSPAAAASIAGFAICSTSCAATGNNLLYAAEIDTVVQTILPFFALLVAVLMVSRIPYPHVVNQVLRGQRSFGHVVALLFAARGDHVDPRLLGADHRRALRAGGAGAIFVAARAAPSRNARADLLAARPDRHVHRTGSKSGHRPRSARLAARQAHRRARRRDQPRRRAGRQHRDQRLLPDGGRTTRAECLAFEAGPETLKHEPCWAS